MNKFIKNNIDIFIIFLLLVLGSNAHVLLQGLLPKADPMDIYLAAQQFSGGSVLMLFVYFLKVEKKNVFKKALALTLFILSVLAFIGEVCNIFQIPFLDQTNKGVFLIGEFAFFFIVLIIGVVRYKRDS